MPKRKWLLMVAIAAAVALRAYASFDSFWLDEIWSVNFYALKAQSPFDILFRMPNNNNHHLVTLWMYVCGEQATWAMYRIPSFLAGVGTILLSWQLGRRWSETTGRIAACLAAGSFILLTYGSEARGYALAGFFSVAAFGVLDRYLRTGRWFLAPIFGVLVLLGFLSHLTMIFFYGGAVAWSLVASYRRANSMRQAILGFAMCHAVAVPALAAFYFASLRNYEDGGGPPCVMSEVIAQTLACTLGVFGTNWPLLVLASVLALGMGVAALVRLQQDGDDVWVFFATTVFVAPGALLLTRPPSLFERFFYVSIVFYLLLLSYLLGRAYQAGTWRRSLAIALLVIITLSNGWRTIPFLRDGRGQYLAAMEYIEANTKAARIGLQSDHDFRNPIVLDFYSDRLTSGRPWVYASQSTATAEPIEWMIAHGFGDNFKPSRTMMDARGSRYRLARMFPYSGLSGFHWAVYRRVPDGDRPAAGQHERAGPPSSANAR